MSDSASPARPSRPLIRAEDIHIQFTGHETVAPQPNRAQDQLYLDVGNALGDGVIDHHHLTRASGSTCSLVHAHPEFVDAAVNPSRPTKARFTNWLHRQPDLDCVASAYLARAYLTQGVFPAAAQSLGEYLDQIDQGHPPSAPPTPTRWRWPFGSW